MSLMPRLGIAAGSSSVADNAATTRLLNAGAEPQNWLLHGGGYAEQRYSTLTGVNDHTVARLGLAWSLELDTNRGQETTPLVVDGIVYVTTAWSKVIAMDGGTGHQLWKYDPHVPPQSAVKGCCDVVNRGAAFYDGKIYVASFDGRLIALDAKTGQPIWAVATTDPKLEYTSTGAPRVVKGKILIGNGGAEFGVRGYVSAYDAQTGKLDWRFYTVPNADGKPDGAVSDQPLHDLAKGGWFGDVWKKTGGGGTAWDSIVYDPGLNQIYVGVGNGSPWNHSIRSQGRGDNLFLASILALDADTGRYKWHYQVNPGEAWDFTATQPIMLATLRIDGADRQVLMQAPKNGFFYVIDRHTGKLISARNFVSTSWASSIDLQTGRPVETAGDRYEKKAFLMSPSSYGAHNWYPMSFSPKTGLVYFPIQTVPFFYANDPHFKLLPETFNLGVYSQRNVVPRDDNAVAAIRKSLTGALIAWDPVAQKEVWRASQAGPANAGTLATAGNLVFEGNPEGGFEAFDATMGRRLWKFMAQTSIIGSPVTYSIGGTQYVVVVSGAGGGYLLNSPFADDKRAKPNGRVLAFRIGGGATLAAYVPPPQSRANPPADHFTPVQVAGGETIYETTCGRCHGAGTLSSGVLPDLRRSALLSDDAGWNSVVLGGALQNAGMVSFAKILTPADVEAVRAYVGSRALTLRATEIKSGMQP